MAGVVLANLGVGFSYGWWVDKHNRHHAHPNDEDKDPDVAAGALVFTTGQARASVRYLIADRTRPRTREALLMSLHIAGYLAFVFLLLPPVKALVFIAVHQALFGLYLGCSFAPNHKGMPQLSQAENADYLLRQVLTSRNVRGHWLTDFALGGLNYQIEHHLFPSMPRPNLRHAQRIVKQFCAAHRVPYLETGLISSYAQALRYLNTVGRSPGTSAAI